MRSVIFAILLGVSCAAGAQLYRWTDDKGRVHVSDTPPPAGAKNVQRKSYGTPVDAPDVAGQPYVLQVAAQKFPVTLYTAPECEPCAAARMLLNARGVPFREVSVVGDKQVEALKDAVGSLSVPSITVGSNTQKGYEQSLYHALLDSAGYPRTGILPPRTQTEPRPAPPVPAPAAGEAQRGEESSAPARGPYLPR